MSMWYFVTLVLLILKDMVCPGCTLICVAKPWMAASPTPFTCQSADGSPGFVFSHAITLVTGGPHGPAAAADPTSTRQNTPRSAASTKPVIKRRPIARRRESPVTDISAPIDNCHLTFALPKEDMHVA